MKYITGIHALNLPCSLETCGDWHTSAIQWNNIDIRESSESIFKDWGIEKCSVTPPEQDRNKEYYIANTLRAILDLMYDGNLIGWLKGFRDDFLCTDKYNNEFFEKVILMKDIKHWSEIDKLMTNEFMFEWIEFKDKKDE